MVIVLVVKPDNAFYSSSLLLERSRRALISSLERFFLFEVIAKAFKCFVLASSRVMFHHKKVSTNTVEDETFGASP